MKKALLKNRNSKQQQYKINESSNLLSTSHELIDSDETSPSSSSLPTTSSSGSVALGTFRALKIKRTKV